MNTLFNRNAKLFILVIVALIIIGLMMVYSSSYIYARDVMGSSWHLIGKQIFFLGFGITILLALMQIPFSFWYRYAYHIQWLSTFLLVLTFTKFVGVNVKGSHRWLSLGGMTLQPGEIVKYSTLLMSIKFFEEFKTLNRDALIIALVTLLSPLVILLAQPDFGTFVICSLIIFFTAFLSSFSKKILAGIGLVGIAGISILLVAAPYRVKRLMTFLDPWSDPRGSGFQIIQSYLAFANGGVTGSGLGASVQKLFYLPEAYNDFILSVIGEELGFVGILLITALFVLMVFFGFRMAMSIENRLGRIFTSGVIFLLGFQAFLNMAVVLGLLPTKGLNLPFISYGGSSLVANLAAIGIAFSFAGFDWLKLRKRLER